MELDELLTHAVKRQASDLHLKADAHPVLRIHGHLEVQDDLPKVTREFMRRNAMRLLGEDRYNDLMGGAEKDLGYQVDGAGKPRRANWPATNESPGASTSSECNESVQSRRAATRPSSHWDMAASGER